MTPRYQAAELHAARGPLHIETVSAAPLAPSDVLARVGAAGLCHTDLEVIDGSLRYPVPIVLGHEGKQTMKALTITIAALAAAEHLVTARLTPQWGTFHFENLVMPPLTKTCPKMVLS